MQASELRKNNIVFFPFHNENVRIIGIPVKEEDNDEYVQVETQGTIFMEKIGVFKEIPISENTLIKLGYLRSLTRKNHFVITGHIIWNCNEMFLCDKTGVLIKTVHQLQNLFYAMNKSELKWKKKH